MTADWTEYTHDDFPDGLSVMWRDLRDHGPDETFLPNGERIDRDGFALMATAEQAIDVAVAMADSGMSYVQIGALDRNEKDDIEAVLQRDPARVASRFRTSYDEKMGWYIDVDWDDQ
jgi:hypothetical protein